VLAVVSRARCCNVRPLDFPPYSPDLNPIENLWADVKKRTDQKQADTKEELEQLLSEQWAATSPALCSKLALSMLHRILRNLGLPRNQLARDFALSSTGIDITVIRTNIQRLINSINSSDRLRRSRLEAAGHAHRKGQGATSRKK
jgi:hypothetical protein